MTAFSDLVMRRRRRVAAAGPAAEVGEMKILVVGTHCYRNQPSMFLFADWVVKSLSERAHVRSRAAPALFLNALTRRSRLAKWLFYVDQFLVLPVLLAFSSRHYDRVIVADHSNSFSTLLVPSRKVAAMVHDMVGVRLALNGIPGAPPAGASGRVMQRLVLAGLRRMRWLAVSSNKVARELVAFGVTAPAVPVGCTLDLQRLATSREPSKVAAEIGGRPFVLNVATDDWRKRKPFLVRTWTALNAANVAAPILVLAGYTQDETVALAEQAGGAVIVADEINDAELVWLYQHCVATIAGSTEEGFCIPILESLYFNKPVLGVRGAAYVEIFGDAIMPFDIDEPERAASAIQAALTDDNRTRAALARRDELVERFSFREFSRRLTRAFGFDEAEKELYLGMAPLAQRRTMAETA